MQPDPKIVAEALLSASILEAIPDAIAAVTQQGSHDAGEGADGKADGKEDA